MYYAFKEYKKHAGVEPLYKRIQLLWLVFLVVNVVFAILVIRVGFQLPQFIEHVGYQLLPLISTPVDYLNGQGNSARANLVQTIYTFNWLTFIIFIALHIKTLIGQTPKIITNNQTHELGGDGIYRKKTNILMSIVMLAGVIYLFVHFIYQGNYDFYADVQVFSDNAVHQRFTDYFVVSILMTCASVCTFFPYFVTLTYFITNKTRSRKGCNV